MERAYNSIAGCFRKGASAEIPAAVHEKDDICKTPVDQSTNESSLQNAPSTVAVNDGILRRVSSGVYNVGAGAVGLGVGTVKWAASSTYSIGSAVVSTGVNTARRVAGAKPKDKNE